MRFIDAQTTVLAGNFLWPMVRVSADDGQSGYGETRKRMVS